MSNGTKAVVVSPKSDLVKAMRKIVAKGFVMTCAECGKELPDARSCYCKTCEAAIYEGAWRMFRSAPRSGQLTDDNSNAGDSARGNEMATRQTILVEYSLDSLGDISADQFELACMNRAEQLDYDVEFRVGLNSRETIDGEPVDLIVERSFAECCEVDHLADAAIERKIADDELAGAAIWDAYEDA